MRGLLVQHYSIIVSWQVKKILMVTGRQTTILNCAAASGCRGMFEATMAALESRLTQEEVRHAILGNDKTWDVV